MFSSTVKTFLNSYGRLLILAAILAAVVIAANMPFIPSYETGDSKWYVAIAEGRIYEVIKPFSSRFLYPVVAGWLDSHFSLGLERSFLLVNIASLFLFFFALAFFFKNLFYRAPLLFVAVLPLPFFIGRLEEFFSPDIFYFFLTALFFLFLFYEREGPALLTLFFLFLARESTAFLGLVFLVVSFLRSKKAVLATTVVVLALSFFAANQVNNLGLPNAHHLSDTAYSVLRMPFLFLRNLFGVVPWVNTLSQTCEPIFKLGMPHWSFLGSIREFGVCGFESSILLNTVISLLTVFGIAPAVVLWLLWHAWRDIFEKMPKWLLAAVLYGLGHYLLTVFVTTGVQRFVGYSWPVFLLAAPFLVNRFFAVDKKFITKLALANLLVIWMSLPVMLNISTTPLSVATILAALAAYAYTFRLLARQPMQQPISTGTDLPGMLRPSGRGAST